MKKLWDWAALAIFFAFPFYCGVVYFNQMTHPELWSDWQYNPAIWGPVAGLLVTAWLIFVGCWGVQKLAHHFRKQPGDDD